MSEKMGKPEMRRRDFLKGLGALAGAAALNTAVAKTVEAASGPESQETRVLSAQEIENLTFKSLDSGSKPDKDALRLEYFGRQDRSAGKEAYFAIKTTLSDQRARYLYQKDKKVILDATEQAISELEELYQKVDSAIAQFHKQSYEYIEAADLYLKLKKTTDNLKLQIEQMRPYIGLTYMPDLEKGQKPDPEHVHKAALALAQANDKLIRFQNR